MPPPERAITAALLRGAPPYGCFLPNPSAQRASPPLSEASKPGLAAPPSPEHPRRRAPPPPPLLHRGATSSGRLRLIQDHPEVTLDSLILFHPLALAAGDRRRRNRDRTAAPFLCSCPEDPIASIEFFSGGFV